MGHWTAMKRPKSLGRHHVREYRRVSTHRACAASDWDNGAQLPNRANYRLRVLLSGGGLDPFTPHSSVKSR